MCGSEPCVQETVAMIKDRKMSVVAAQMALSSLPDRVPMPSRNILKHIQDLYISSSDQQVGTYPTSERLYKIRHEGKKF